MDTLWQKLYFLLSKEKREEWAKRYKRRFGKDFIPPEQPIRKDERGIVAEPKIENLEEIDRLMRQPSKGAWHE